VARFGNETKITSSRMSPFNCNYSKALKTTARTL
jgi:hypothetical protein